MTEQDLPIPDYYVNFHAKYNFAYLDGLPYRILDDFALTDANSNHKGLEELANGRLIGKGRVIDPTDEETPLEQRDGIKVTFEVREWSIEYEDSPALWICTKSAWYKLMRPAPHYAPSYKKVLTRFKAVTSVVQRLQEDAETTTAMTLDDWGEFCREKTNGAVDKTEILEEADFIVQQMIFLDEDIFLNSSIYKALTEHLNSKKTRRSKAAPVTPAKRKLRSDSEMSAPKRRRVAGAEEKKIEQQVEKIKRQQMREKQLRENLEKAQEKKKRRDEAAAARKAARDKKNHEKLLLKLAREKDDLEFVPTVDYQSEFTPLNHDFLPDLVMVWEFLNSFKTACNFKIPNFTLTELYQAVIYTLGKPLQKKKAEVPDPGPKSKRRGRKKGRQNDDEPEEKEFVIDAANVIDDERALFLMKIHHALIAPLLHELEEKAILGDVMDTVDEEHLIAELIEQVEELDETVLNADANSSINHTNMNNGDAHPIDVEQPAEGSGTNTNNNGTGNSNVNTETGTLKDVLPAIPLTSIEFNSITWIEVVRLYLMKRSELFDYEGIIGQLNQHEYFNLPVDSKIKILAFLCNEFMLTTPFRVAMEKNMSRKTVLAIQLRDVKREYRTLQQERKKELEAKGIADNTTPVGEDHAAQLARKKFEKEEKRLKLEIATLSADLKAANRTLRLSPAGQDRMFDKYWTFPPNELKNILLVECIPQHEAESLRQNSTVNDQIVDMNVGGESLFNEQTGTTVIDLEALPNKAIEIDLTARKKCSVADGFKVEVDAPEDGVERLKKYLFTGHSSWGICNKDAQLKALMDLLDEKSSREKKLKEVLQPLRDTILTKDRVEAAVATCSTENQTVTAHQSHGNAKTLTADNVMSSYFKDDVAEKNNGRHEVPVKLVDEKIIKQLRADLLDLEDCIPFESIILQNVDWEEWRRKVSSSNESVTLIESITLLEQTTNPKSFKSAWLKRERRLFKELAKQARTTAQMGVLLDLMRRNIKSTEDYTQSCIVCNDDENADSVLLCDKCDKGFHLTCLSPPLESVPAGFWFCKDCKEKLEQGRKNKAQRTSDEGYFCTKCQDGGDLLCCDSCPRVYHMKCLSPPLKAIPEEDWFCPYCVEKAQQEAAMIADMPSEVLDAIEKMKELEASLMIDVTAENIAAAVVPDEPMNEQSTEGQTVVQNVTGVVAVGVPDGANEPLNENSTTAAVPANEEQNAPAIKLQATNSILDATAPEAVVGAVSVVPDIATEPTPAEPMQVEQPAEQQNAVVEVNETQKENQGVISPAPEALKEDTAISVAVTEEQHAPSSENQPTLAAWVSENAVTGPVNVAAATEVSSEQMAAEPMRVEQTTESQRDAVAVTVIKDVHQHSNENHVSTSIAPEVSKGDTATAAVMTEEQTNGNQPTSAATDAAVSEGAMSGPGVVTSVSNGQTAAESMQVDQTAEAADNKPATSLFNMGEIAGVAATKSTLETFNGEAIIEMDLGPSIEDIMLQEAEPTVMMEPSEYRLTDTVAPVTSAPEKLPADYDSSMMLSMGIPTIEELIASATSDGFGNANQAQPSADKMETSSGNANTLVDIESMEKQNGSLEMATREQ